jgi:hypothetical protein
MKPVYVRVEGHSGWYKDLNSGTVINTNEQEIAVARKTRENSKVKQQEKDKMEKDVASLRSEIEELKEIIKGMVGK